MRRVSVHVILVMLVLLLWGGAPAVVQAAGQGAIRLLVNGEQITTDVDPVIVNDRTMVPLRVIADNLGRDVRWDSDNRRVILSSTIGGDNILPSRGGHKDRISIVVDGKEIPSEVPPFIREGRTMVPVRIIAEGLGMKVSWDPALQCVFIDEPAPSQPEQLSQIVIEPPETTNISIDSMVDNNTPIMGSAQASADQMKALLLAKNPGASPDMVDLYLEIGKQYGLRGDIAFCQAAKETRWWQFGGLVQQFQNNYCGLGATGVPATGTEGLLDADSARVCYQPGVHGAIFATPADGVEAHIQHLYAYACDEPLPAGKTLVDPRFSKPARGCAARWVDLSGKWAVPGYDRSFASFEEAYAAGKTYGQSILNDYYAYLLIEP